MKRKLRTGWTAVQRDVKIDYDLESFPLHIKTDSLEGSVRLHLFSVEGNTAGSIRLHLSSYPPQYRIFPCTGQRIDFPSDLPNATDKIWRITLSRTPEIRIVIHCNDVEVANQLISDSTCSSENWDTFWSRDVEKIKFGGEDTASDQYLSYPGNYGIIIKKR